MRNQTIKKIFTRDFILGFISQFAFTIAYHVLYPTLPIFLSRLGASEVDIGVLIGILGVSSLVFRPFIGRALLKTPEKNFMIAGAILFVLYLRCLSLCPPFLALFHGEDLSRDGAGLFLYSLIYIYLQYQPRSPSGAKPQLLFISHQYFFSHSAFLWNVHYQPI